MGEEQLAQALLSRLQTKLEPASLEAKEKLAEVAVVVAGGPLVIDVCGAAVSPADGSTLQDRVAAAGSTFPAASIASTEKLCLPVASPPKVFGELHDSQALPSRLQAKLEPASLEPKEKLAVLLGVVAAGLLIIDVCGELVSPVGARGLCGFFEQLRIHHRTPASQSLGAR